MNILTFDIEDWWIYERYNIGKASDYLPRLEYYLNNILDRLDEKQINATFFCLGIMAEKYPGIVKSIVRRGHQIGCHSYSHDFFGSSSYKEFSDDTKKALEILENITGSKITAYRAPAFSITENNKWALEILVRNGILYDCSIFPANRSFGGFPNYISDKPAVILYNGLRIKEFPISLTRVFGKEIAYSGGGYFRLFPYAKLKTVISGSGYVMTYFHIKDFDREQEKKFGSLAGENAVIRYFKNYYGLSSCFSKFNKMLDDFRFISLEQADKIINWDKAEVIEL